MGENAIKMMTVGGGSSSLKVQKEILPLDGIRTRFDKSTVEYARGYVGDTVQSYNGVTVGRSLYESRSESQLTQEAVNKARVADVVIFIGGLNKSDYQDCEGHDRKQYGLPYNQDKLIEALAAANPNTVVVNISGNSVAMPWISKVSAIVQAWYLGSESGEAIASILSGDTNPSGKLPFTWYSDLNQCGAHFTDSYPGTWRPAHDIIDEEYKEDIFVGYRFTDKNKLKPLFPFGHGLSYTTFEISEPKADKNIMTENDKINISVTIKNTGKVSGSQVLQLYISDLQSSVIRPVKELKGFQKVYLTPGETREITFSIDKSALSFYDDKTHSWTAEKGKFSAFIGLSAGETGKAVKFELK